MTLLATSRTPSVELALRALFPKGTVVRCANLMFEDVLECEPSYEPVVRNAVLSRQREFLVGRQLATESLRELGFGQGAVLRGTRGQPLWPAGIAGSIAHSQELCVAAVATVGVTLSLGVDIESLGAVAPDLSSEIASAEELFRLKEEGLSLTQLFCAKEAFFKCQYPMIGAEAEFHDVELFAGPSGSFQVHPRRAGFEEVSSMTIMVATACRHVVAAAWL